MRPELQLAFDAAKNLEGAELVPFLMELREVELTALARLWTPPATTVTPILSDDDALSIAESARYLGMSTKWVYANEAALPAPERKGTRIHYRRGDLRIWREQHKIPHKRR